MSIADGTVVIEALLLLRTQFPQNPEVLYTSVHFFFVALKPGRAGAGQDSPQFLPDRQAERRGSGIAEAVGGSRGGVPKNPGAAPQTAGDSFPHRAHSSRQVLYTGDR